ncbi:MAG: TPM domain-containing protein [Pseudomonadota bacterium]
MALLKGEDRRRIEAAIRTIEARTSGELVTVVADAADPYFFVSLLYATAGAFTLPPVLWALGVATEFLPLYAIQIATFLALLAFLRWRPALMSLVPDSVKHAHAARMAREQFVELGLANTPERGGVLLFVAAAERYVEIIADQGIHAKVPADAWSKAVAAFQEPIRAGRTADGFLAAIEAVGALLMHHMPVTEENPNRLPDVLIEIGG